MNWKCILPALAAVGLASSALGAPTRTVTVHAARRACLAAPVEVIVTPPKGMWGATVSAGGAVVPSQSARRGGRLAVSWVVRDLAQGTRRDYLLTFVKTSPAARSATITVKPFGAPGPATGQRSAEITMGGELFARYDVATGPNKPFFHPIFAPGGKQVVRGLPTAPRAGETTDHPHHQGLWFTHGAVNGDDYWALTPSKTIHTGYADMVSGPVYGGFTLATDWIGKSGRKVATDTRIVRFYDLAGARVMDFDITVKPVGEPLVLGDTKEGSFGLRLPDTMRLKGGDGVIVNSEGVSGGATWGKRAAWVDYSGTVDGSTVGVAILDHPTSFRHPTHWHVRDYGLFCANPFGIHDFEPGKSATIGNHTVPVGGALKLRYRVVVHAGNSRQARVAERWGDYSEPPTITVR
jgi:hypothetical protein